VERSSPDSLALMSETVGELRDDPVAQHVGHAQDLDVDLVVRGDVVRVPWSRATASLSVRSRWPLMWAFI
jgi:hypothetical protein